MPIHSGTKGRTMVVALPAMNDARTLGQLGGAAGPIRIGGTKALRGVGSLGAPRSVMNVVPSQGAFAVSGITRDNTGIALAGCTVKLFTSVDDKFIAETVSDVSGAFSFAATAGPYFCVAWGPTGAVAGVTLDTLTGA